MTEAFLTFFLIAVVGILARQSIRKVIDPVALRQAINTIVLYILLPAYLFAAVCRIDLDSFSWQMPAALGAGAMGSLILGIFAYGFFSIDQRTKGALVLAGAFGNIACFWVPACVEIHEEADLESLHRTGAAMIACAVVAGSILACWYGTAGRNSFAFLRAVGAPLRLPPVWALIAGVMVKVYTVTVPAWIIDGADLLSAGITGLLILSLGLCVRFPKTNELGPILPALAIKLVLFPVILFLAIKTLGEGAGNDPGPSLTVVGVLPTQLLVLALAERFKLDCTFLGLVIVVNTALSFWTIPLIHGLLYR